MRFIPFLGSSEWIRFDSVHPAVLAEKYHRPYRPYFLGQAGAASLNQYFGLQQILPEIENKQAVFVISPQWFTETDYEPAAFQRFFNSDQLTAFLGNQSGDIAAKHAAIRLLKQNPNVALKGIVQKLSKGEELSEVDQVAIDIFARFNEKQSALFGQFSIRGKLKYKEHVENYLKDLPDQFSYDELEKIVRKDAEANTTNNDMGMENHFYTREVQKDLKKMGRVSKKITTSSSPLNTMICSWSSINLLSRMSMCSLSFSRLTRSGWSTQGSVKRCTSMLWRKFVTN